MRKVLILLLLVYTYQLKAIETSISINGSSATNITVAPCGTLHFLATCTKNFTCNVSARIYLNGGWIKQYNKLESKPIKTYDPKGNPVVNDGYELDCTINMDPGDYSVRFFDNCLGADIEWNAQTTQIIKVSFATNPTVFTTIDNNSSSPINICPGSPIIMNTSGTCGSSYYVSVVASDENWNQIGEEASGSYDGNAPATIDIRSFCSDKGFNLSEGGFYRVKLAVRPGWVETVKLIYLPFDVLVLNSDFLNRFSAGHFMFKARYARFDPAFKFYSNPNKSLGVYSLTNCSGYKSALVENNTDGNSNKDWGLTDKENGNCRVFPNPSSGIFTAFFSKPKIQRTIQVFDLNTKLVYSNKSSDSELHIDLGDKPNGVYILKIIETGGIETVKLIKE